MASYYVAPNIASGSGTLSSPWGISDLLIGPGGGAGYPTPGVALTTPVAGDTLFFRGGDYHFTGSSNNGDNTRQLLSPQVSGTLSQPITFQAYPGETVNIYEDNGTQPVLGTELPTVDYVRFIGLTVFMTPNDYHGPGIRLSGVGNEVGYCEVVGTFVNIGDNHDGIRIDYSTNAWIHHNDVHGVQGTHYNSAGIKIYHSVLSIIEDNYIHDCYAGVFDKDADVFLGDYAEKTTYRRNWITNNFLLPWIGNLNTTVVGIYYIYDNVIDNYSNRTDMGTIRINDFVDAPANQCQIYNNLFRSSTPGQEIFDAKNSVQQNIWNNISICGGISFIAFHENYTQFAPSGVTAPLTYLDYNVYDGTPSYQFGVFTTPTTFTIAQMRAQQFEVNSRIDSATNIFVDQVSYALKTSPVNYTVAGRFGDMVGPRNGSPVGPSNTPMSNSVAQIINVNKYGPSAQQFSQTTAISGPPYEKLTAGTTKSVYPGRGW